MANNNETNPLEKKKAELNQDESTHYDKIYGNQTGEEETEEEKAVRRNTGQSREYGVSDNTIKAKLEKTGTAWDNLKALQENKPVVTKPKGYHLSQETIDGVKVLAKRLKKTESQFVDEVLSEIVEMYTVKKGRK